MTYKLPHGFRTVAVSGQTDVDAPGDGILTLTAGTNVTLTTSGSAVTVAASGGGGGGEASASVELEYDNTCFDLGTTPYTAKTTAITGLTIPANATVTALTLETTVAFAQDTGTPMGEVSAIKLGNTYWKILYYYDSGGYLTNSVQYLGTTTTSRFGSMGIRYDVGVSSINPSLIIQSVTNDTAYTSGYLTAGKLALTVYYTT